MWDDALTQCDERYLWASPSQHFLPSTNIHRGIEQKFIEPSGPWDKYEYLWSVSLGKDKNGSLTCDLQEVRVCRDLSLSGLGFCWGQLWVFMSNESILASVTELSCMRLPEVTKLLLLSESGNLYLALQVAHYGLCLGALQFRLQCVLLHEGGGLWISNRLSGDEQACCMVSDQLCLDLKSFQLLFFLTNLPPISGGAFYLGAFFFLNIVWGQR